MTIIEKLKAEQGNLTTITLYEGKGIFVNAFERSAFALTLDVKTFEPNVFHNGQLKMKYISIGIPKKNIKQYLAKYKYSTDEPEPDLKVYVVRLEKPLFTEDEFQKWKDSVIVNKFDENARKKGKKENPYIIDCKNVGKSDGNATVVDSTSVAATPTPETPALPPVIPPMTETSSLNDADRERMVFLDGVADDIMAVQIQDFSPMKALNYLSELQNRIRDARKPKGQ